MRVTIITQQSPVNGSAYFRALQYAPLLAERGLDTVLAPAHVAVRHAPGPAGAAMLLAEHAARYTLRAVELRSLVATSDAVMVQRGAYPIGPSLVLHSLRRFDGRVLYDLDDAIFLPSPTLAHKSKVTRWAYRDRQSRSLLERADRIVVSTPELDAALPSRAADVVLPTIPDVWAYATATHDESGPLRLGWIGSAGNIRYLDPLRDLLAQLAREGLAKLEVVSAIPWTGPASFRPWDRASETDAVTGFEVGLMPVPDSPYTQAKAGFKLLQYMAAGCAVIASPVGVNRQLVERSGCGLLADTVEEWEKLDTCARVRRRPASGTRCSGSALRTHIRGSQQPRRRARRPADGRRAAPHDLVTPGFPACLIIQV